MSEALSQGLPDRNPLAIRESMRRGMSRQVQGILTLFGRKGTQTDD